MEKPIFQIAQKQYTRESAVVSVRMPKDMLADIDEAARISGRTRNEIITLALEFALGNLVITAAAKPEDKTTIAEKK
ncbi:MAG: CopG family transcriptional regulator [Oscillospiraceae bacterium]|nr:CopG family transcriptional regulator [Oscillospiraceae bacterium]